MLSPPSAPVVLHVERFRTIFAIKKKIKSNSAHNFRQDHDSILKLNLVSGAVLQNGIILPKNLE